MVETKSDGERYAKIQLDNAMEYLAKFAKAGLLKPDNGRMTKAEVREKFGSKAKYDAINPEPNNKKTFSGSIEFDNDEGKNGN